VDRDAELLRRASKMQRFLFSFFMGKNGKTQDPGEVFYNYDPSESDTFLEDGVYASRFESTASGKARGSIYQLVNRVGADKTVQFKLKESGVKVYDCYAGVKLEAQAVLTLRVEALGLACLATFSNDADNDAEFVTFLQEMREMTQNKPLSGFDTTYHITLQKMEPKTAEGKPAVATRLSRNEDGSAANELKSSLIKSENKLIASLGELQSLLDATSDASNLLAKSTKMLDYLNSEERLIKIEGAQDYHFYVQGQEIEGGEVGTDAQYPWETAPHKTHDHVMNVSTFYLDKYPVTQADYALFLQKSGYKPAGWKAHNFLKNWDLSSGSPKPRADSLKKPVTYLGHAEAKAYCAWRGARLPHSYEWQFAAQNGDDKKVYPWCAEGDAECNRAGSYDFASGERAPAWVWGRATPEPMDVDAFELKGGKNSYNNVTDLVGNVWQYTDSFADEHTRGVVVRGSARYFSGPPKSSSWYFPRAYELQKSNKMLLMDDTYERNAMTGFRCAADAVAASNAGADEQAFAHNLVYV